MADALLIAAHGSRDEAGVEEFWALADSWQRLRPDRLQAAGFLEFERPTIGEAVDRLVERGATRIAVVPAMLTAAGHVKNDVPAEIHEARVRYPDVAFAMGRPLDVHSGLLELCHIRYREAISGLAEIAPDRTLLLLVGRGTSDPDANAGIARVMRFLWESTGAGWASVAYSGLTPPDVDTALTVCRRLAFDRIVVIPYLLFDGVLLKRVRETVAQHAALDARAEIVSAAHLRLHPLLLLAFEDRAHEAFHGSPSMNCDVCKYRVRLIGREGDLRAAQVAHHHQVRAPDGDGHDHEHRRSPQSGVVEPAVLTFHPWDERLLQRLELSPDSR